MSSCTDRQGRLWFGTEDKGVWCYDADAPDDRAWRQFTTKDGLGDDFAYALAVDARGRVWVGHQSRGVSVWNGRAWQNYDTLSGPLGERVFDIAVSPRDGSVWIGTNRGITRYDDETRTWGHFTRANGLSSDQIQSLAFARDGTLFVGTQADGLAIGSPRGGYSKWQWVEGHAVMPVFAAGAGIPSNLINDVLVGRDNTVYVATGYGLARSRDLGRTWEFLRGKDWQDKINGSTFKRAVPPQPKRDELSEDYVTALAEDAAGRIWIGHPTRGVEVRTSGGDFSLGGGVVELTDEEQERERQKQRERLEQEGFVDEAPEPPRFSQQERTDYVTSILPIAGSSPLVCAYGAGVIQLGSEASAPMPRSKRRRGDDAASTNTLAPLPAFALPPTTEELQTLGREVQGLKAPSTKARRQPLHAAYIGEDWTTKGDWLGRYGTRYALLCSMGAPLDHRVVNDMRYHVEGRLGLHPYLEGATYAEQSLRHWMHSERWDDGRVLYNPLIGYRRQADSDDNGEVYPLHYEGPDIWMGVSVPAGTHRVSLYFFNKDGHDGANRVRDYIIDVKQGVEDLVEAEASPNLARARVRDFWGGVYKNFTLEGPNDYYFVLRKNNSFNTIVQAVLIDKLAGPEDERDVARDIYLGDVRYEAPTPKEQDAVATAVLAAAAPREKARLQAALDLWTALDNSWNKRGAETYHDEGRVLAYRALRAAAGQTESGQSLMWAWRWKLPLWPDEDRSEFTETMKQAWERFNLLHPTWKNLPR